MDLNERQITAVKHIERYGKITRTEYERLCLVSARTANRELGVLFKKNLVEKKGKGPETYYVLARSGEIKEGVDKPYYLDGIAYKRVGTENVVLSHIKKAAKIVGFERQEVWEYPINALREAIVNAICHRDYVYSSDITIGVFDDRIEISNPGMLPEPLTPEDLKKTHKSIPRNPLVANAFFLIKNIEQWGEGTNKIVKWCFYHCRR